MINNILVTGSSGLIGTQLFEKLLKQTPSLIRDLEIAFFIQQPESNGNE